MQLSVLCVLQIIIICKHALCCYKVSNAHKWSLLIYAYMFKWYVYVISYDIVYESRLVYN